ncbi:MAG: SLC45 family MFS transporter [Chloroflexi bacterium]|nr:MAG: SLC45 family MFS transporter [Chloroflexota bacterium]
MRYKRRLMESLDKRTTALYSAGSIGAGAFFAFNNFVLPTILKGAGAPDLLTGLLSSTRSIEGVVIQPTVGAVSDRIWTPHLGRRRIFIAVGIPLSAFFFVIAGFFTHTLLGLAIAIFLFSIFFNAAVDPYAALLADIAPVHERGLLSGVSTAVQLLAQVAFLVVVSRAAASGEVPLWTYALVGAVMVASFAATVFGIKERRDLIARKEHYSWGRYVRAVVSHGAAMRYLLTLFVYQFGINAVLPYLTLFIIEDIGESAEVAFALAGLTLLVTAISAVASGKIAERFGTRAVLAAGWAILVLGAIGGTIVHGLPQTVGVVVLAGIGNGAATAMSWPLLTELIPHDETGVFAGLKAASESVAIPLSIFVAAELFLPRFGYRGIFAMLAINIVLALALLFLLVRSRGAGPVEPALAAAA